MQFALNITFLQFCIKEVVSSYLLLEYNFSYIQLFNVDMQSMNMFLEKVKWQNQCRIKYNRL